MDDNNLDLVIVQGKSFSKPLQWEQAKYVYKAIAAATQANPCVLTVGTHGMPDGWGFEILSAKVMTQLNRDPDTGLFANGKDEYTCTLVDPNTVELNDVAASGFKAYTANSGSIRYRAPYDLAGYTARMKARADWSSTASLLDLTTANGGIVLDNTLKTVTIALTDAQTAAITWDSAVYDLEMVDAGGKVTELVKGSITIEKEVTR